MRNLDIHYYGDGIAAVEQACTIAHNCINNSMDCCIRGREVVDLRKPPDKEPSESSEKQILLTLRLFPPTSPLQYHCAARLNRIVADAPHGFIYYT